jgi:hypothetical protein
MAQRWFAPCLISVAYFGVAQLGRLLVNSTTSAASVWPASGAGLAAALRCGQKSAAVGIAIGSIAHLITMYFTTERYHKIAFLAISPAFAAINILEAVAGASFVRLATKQTSGWFETGRGALLFFAPLPFAPLLSGYLIALILAAIGITPYAYIGRLGAAFWLGRLGGMYALAPALSNHLGLSYITRILGSRPLQLVSTYAITAGIFLFTFLGGWGLVNYTQVLLVVFPATALLVFVTPFLNIQQVMGAVLTAMLMVIIGSARGTGSFSGPHHSQMFWLVLEQTYVCVTSAKIIWIAILSHEKDNTTFKIQQMNKLLEVNVQHRTSELAAAIDRADKTTRQKLGFAKHVLNEVRTPLIGLQKLCQRALDPKSLRARVSSTAKLLVTVLDDLVTLGTPKVGLCALKA